MQAISSGREVLNLWQDWLASSQFISFDYLVALANDTIFNGLAIDKFISGIASLPVVSLDEVDIDESLNFLNDLLGLDLQIR